MYVRLISEFINETLWLHTSLSDKVRTIDSDGSVICLLNDAVTSKSFLLLTRLSFSQPHAAFISTFILRFFVIKAFSVRIHICLIRQV